MSKEFKQKLNKNKKKEVDIYTDFFKQVFSVTFFILVMDAAFSGNTDRLKIIHDNVEEFLK